ncbi:MAG: hypothetical protein AAF197_04400 [Pseudomonadota bacterium]
MDEQTKQDLFRSLGSIESRLDALESSLKDNSEKLEKVDCRVRSTEIKSAGLSSILAFIVSVGMNLIKGSSGS